MPAPPRSDARLDWRERAIGRPAGVDETSCVVNESRIEMTRPDSIVYKQSIRAGQLELTGPETKRDRPYLSHCGGGGGRAARAGWRGQLSEPRNLTDSLRSIRTDDKEDGRVDAKEARHRDGSGESRWASEGGR